MEQSGQHRFGGGSDVVVNGHAVRFGEDQAAFPQLFQVLGNGGHGHAQYFAQVAHAEASFFCQQQQDFQPHLIAGQRKGAGQIRQRNVKFFQAGAAAVNLGFVPANADTGLYQFFIFFSSVPLKTFHHENGASRQPACRFGVIWVC